MPDTPLKIPGKLPKDVLKAKKKKGGARPDSGATRYEATEADRRLVRLATIRGLSQDRMCRLIINPHTKKPISTATLYKHYRRDMETAEEEIACDAVGTIWGAIREGDVNAAFKYLQVRAGPGWNPSLNVNVDVKHEYESLSHNQRLHLIAAFFDKGGDGPPVIDVDAETEGDAGRTAIERDGESAGKVVALDTAERPAKKRA